MEMDDAFRYFLDIPAFDRQLAVDQAASNVPRFDYRLMHAMGSGAPELDDLIAVARLSHENRKIRLANPDFTLARRKALYAEWFYANPKTFLLLVRSPPEANGGRAVIGKTIVLPLKYGIFSIIRNGNLRITELRAEHICKEYQSYDILLFDTWVLHKHYQDYLFTSNPFAKWRRIRHGGFGRALPLKHLTLFADLGARRRKPLEIYAEPDSKAMLKALALLGFENVGQTRIGEPLLRLQYPPPAQDRTNEDYYRALLIKSLARTIQTLKEWPLMQ